MHHEHHSCNGIDNYYSQIYLCFILTKTGRQIPAPPRLELPCVTWCFFSYPCCCSSRPHCCLVRSSQSPNLQILTTAAARMRRKRRNRDWISPAPQSNNAVKHCAIFITVNVLMSDSLFPPDRLSDNELMKACGGRTAHK